MCSLQVKQLHANLVSDIVLEIREEIEPVIQDSPSPSTMKSPISEFTDDNSFALIVQMNAVTVDPMVTALQAQVTQMKQMMKKMQQSICQPTQQQIFSTYSQTPSHHSNSNQQ